MIELQKIRFVEYDKNTNRISVLLLTEENEGMSLEVLIGLPEVMTRETIDGIMMMNQAVAKNFDEDDEIDLQRIDRDKMDSFYEQVVAMVIQGRMRGALELPISQESAEE